MSESPATRQFVYETRSQGRLAPYLFLAGGVCAVAFAALGFYFSVTRKPENKVDPFAQQTLTTLPILFAIGAFSYAVSLFRTPRRIVLSIDGISLESSLKKREIPWDQIDRVETDKKITFVPGGEVEIVVLRDAAGGKIAVLPSTIRHFADLSERLQRIVSRRTGNRTVSAKAKRSKRAAAFFIFFGFFMTAAGVSICYEAWSESNTRILLESEGVDTEATIVKREMYNGIAPWLVYKFRDSSGKEFERRALLTTKNWNLLEGAKTVPVRYIRSNPAVSHVEGEVPPGVHTDPKMAFLMGPAAALMSLLFFVVGILRWKNLDLTFDEKRFRFRLKRIDGNSPNELKATLGATNPE
jgi:hypothetical protein